jgi:hypothetical protein
MIGAVPPLLQYVFMAWCLIKQWIRLQGMVLSYRQEQIYRLPLSWDFIRSRDISVVKRRGTGWMIGGFESRQGLGVFSPHHGVQTGCVAHPASYPVGSRGSFPGGKAAGP